MALKFDLAMIKVSGQKSLKLKFSLLFMKRRLADLPRIEGSSLMRLKGRMVLKCQSMEL